MAYTATAYTTLIPVKRILRTSTQKTKIGDNDGDDMTNDDATAYILDASMKIDGMLRIIIKINQIPLVDHTLYPEILYSAPRLAAFLIYRDLYSVYRIEDLPPGPKGWLDDSEDNLKIFVENIKSGIYPTLSPATDGPGWVTAQATFQNLIGVSVVHDQVPNVTNQVPSSLENIGPNT